MPLFERQLVKNGTGFLVGNQFSYVDFIAFEIFEIIAPFNDLQDFPMIKALHNKLKEHPNIKAFMESDMRKTTS